MNNAGIDYGRGQTNIDFKTGIRYGVIPVHALDSWIYEELEAYYGTPEELEELEDSDWDFMEPLSFTLNINGYTGEMGDSQDIFLTDSKYYTLAKFCSPCAAGAGYLLDHIPDGVKTYCFGHDYFEGGVAPYPVYSVETGEIVEPQI